VVIFILSTSDHYQVEKDIGVHQTQTYDHSLKKSWSTSLILKLFLLHVHSLTKKVKPNHGE